MELTSENGLLVAFIASTCLEYYSDILSNKYSCCSSKAVWCSWEIASNMLLVCSVFFKANLPHSTTLMEWALHSTHAQPGAGGGKHNQKRHKRWAHPQCPWQHLSKPTNQGLCWQTCPHVTFMWRESVILQWAEWLNIHPSIMQHAKQCHTDPFLLAPIAQPAMTPLLGWSYPYGQVILLTTTILKHIEQREERRVHSTHHPHISLGRTPEEATH